MKATRHPSGVRVIRRETTRELGPAENESVLLHALARDIAAERISDVHSVAIEWRDDGCYLSVYGNVYVLLREVGCGTAAPRPRR